MVMEVLAVAMVIPALAATAPEARKALAVVAGVEVDSGQRAHIRRRLGRKGCHIPPE